MNRDELARAYSLREPVAPEMIEAVETAIGDRLHPEYASFLKLSNGLATEGDLVLLEVEEVAQRNEDYAVKTCLPGYLMIGDDSGGVAILLKSGERAVYEVDMGVMDETDIRVSAESLGQLLLEYQGLPFGERQRK